MGAEGALEIRVLHRHGKGIREIARDVGIARNTVRRYLRDGDGWLPVVGQEVGEVARWLAG